MTDTKRGCDQIISEKQANHKYYEEIKSIPWHTQTDKPRESSDQQIKQKAKIKNTKWAEKEAPSAQELNREQIANRTPKMITDAHNTREKKKKKQ